MVILLILRIPIHLISLDFHQRNDRVDLYFNAFSKYFPEIRDGELSGAYTLENGP